MSPPLPALTIEAIEAAATRLAPYIIETPVHRWRTPGVEALFGPGLDLWVKLELLQVTGSFKPRGALNVALSQSPTACRRGFTAFSSGNHAAAVAYAARILGTAAKVVMLETSNPARIENCRRMGAEVLIAPDGHSAVEMVEQIRTQEGKVAIHPYEGPFTSAGTATLGLELLRQVPDLDAVVVAIGGGGLCSGLASAIKLLRPGCEVLAVEPTGADTMYRSFRSGHPESLVKADTIADSLAPPHVQPYSFGLCRAHVDKLALVSDREIRAAMRLLYRELKLAVEPGGAAALAGMIGPYRDRIKGKKVGLIACGSNIDLPTFSLHVNHPEEDSA